MTGRLVQLSGVIVDHTYWVKEVPAPGAEAIVSRVALCAGGGFNAMVAARRAGLAVAYAGTLGTGPFAGIAAEALAAEGIEVLRPRLADKDQGCCTCLIDLAGERTFSASSGADGVVTDQELLSVKPREGDWFRLSGYALGYRQSRAALTRWLAAAPQGLRLVFDPSPLVAEIPEESRAAAQHAASWISANRAEAMILTDVADPAAAAEALAKGRTGGAVVRDGANGCHVAAQDGHAVHIPGLVVDVKDTNGAGDAHIGAFIAALVRGEPPLRAAHFANIAAALSTTREGPSTAPHLNEVLAILGPAPGVAGAA